MRKLKQTLQKDDFTRRGLERSLVRLKRKASLYHDTVPANPLAADIAQVCVKEKEKKRNLLCTMILPLHTRSLPTLLRCVRVKRKEKRRKERLLCTMILANPLAAVANPLAADIAQL